MGNKADVTGTGGNAYQHFVFSSIWKSPILSQAQTQNEKSNPTHPHSHIIDIEEGSGIASVLVSLDDLEKYYLRTGSWRGQREVEWKKKLGKDLNWSLSFDHLREKAI